MRYGYRTDKIMFGAAGALIAGFALWGAGSTETLTQVASSASIGVITHDAWIFTLLAAVVLSFPLYVGSSRYGRTPGKGR